MTSAIEHYSQSGLPDRLLKAFEEAGLDPINLTLDEIAPMSEFHVMGRKATERLAHLGKIRAEHKVLDLGCGIGGPARYLASTYGCPVTGVDLTPDYVEMAQELSQRTGHSALIEFITADATALPFPNESFDLAWSQHCNMNIENKALLFSEIARVLRPAGPYLMHEIFSDNPDSIRFPVPWASLASISHLMPARRAQDLLQAQGFEIEEWCDLTQESHDWFVRTLEKMDSETAPPLTLKLLLPGFREMAGNLKAALQQRSATIIMARLRKRGEPNA